MTSSSPSGTPVSELLPATSRALTHRIAVGQAEGRTPSLVGAVARDGGQAWCGAGSTYLDAGPAAGATIAQLLSHTAGLPSETPGPWWERSPGDLRPGLGDILGPPPHPAGRLFHYSNPGYGLLGALVGRLRRCA